MLSRVLVLCLAGGAAAAALPSCSGSACDVIEEADEVELLQVVVQVSEGDTPRPSMVEGAFPRKLSYMAGKMSPQLAA